LLTTDKNKKFAVISEGFLKTTFDLRRRSFDVNYSGTTVISVMITGKKLVCANVGDSRAILGCFKSKSNLNLGPSEKVANNSSHD
jgi:serine/threonine protein phosphatase PrpC